MFQLESLRKGEGLIKDKDELQEANTFDPDDVKSTKSNKRRQKEREKTGMNFKIYFMYLCKHVSAKLRRGVFIYFF